jgi:hypothetical protein
MPFSDCDHLGCDRAFLYVNNNILEEHTACIFRFKEFRLKNFWVSYASFRLRSQFSCVGKLLFTIPIGVDWVLPWI